MTEQYILFAFVYLAEALIALQFFGELFLKKRSNLVCALIYFVSYGIGYLSFSIFTITMNVTVFAILNLFILLYCYNCNFGTALFHTIIFTGLMLITENIAAVLIGLVCGDMVLYQSQFVYLVLLSSLSKLLLFLCVRLYILFSKQNRSHSITSGPAVLLLSFTSIASLLILLANIYIVFSVKQITATMAIWISLSAMAILFLNIGIYASYQYLQKINFKYTELLLLQQKEQADENYFKTLQEQYDNQRILIHDIRHHLDTLKTLSIEKKTDAITDYVTEIEQVPELQRKIQYSKNSVVNAIIIRYAEICKSRNIKLNVDIRNCNFDFFEKYELTTILCNLLENAVEAAKGVEKSFIDISIDMTEHQKMLVAIIRNSSNHSPNIGKDDKIMSSKRDNMHHGIGLKSVEKTLKKYNGQIQFKYDDSLKVFSTIITVPVKSKSFD
jgi:two-component system sensor histidine kinase AgrC